MGYLRGSDVAPEYFHTKQLKMDVFPLYCKLWFYLILAADMRKSTGKFMNVSSRFIQHLVSVFIFSRSAYLSKLPNYKHSVFPISHIRFDIIQCIH